MSLTRSLLLSLSIVLILYSFRPTLTKVQIFEERIYVLDRFSAEKVFIFDMQGSC